MIDAIKHFLGSEYSLEYRFFFMQAPSLLFNLNFRLILSLRVRARALCYNEGGLFVLVLSFSNCCGFTELLSWCVIDIATWETSATDNYKHDPTPFHSIDWDRRSSRRFLRHVDLTVLSGTGIVWDGVAIYVDESENIRYRAKTKNQSRVAAVLTIACLASYI